MPIRPDRDALAGAMSDEGRAEPVNFIGDLAKTFSKEALKRAEELAKKGVGRDEILKETGMFRQQGFPGAGEGMVDKSAPWNWKTEIPGSQAKISDRLAQHFSDPYMLGSSEAPLGQLLDYPDLYAAYPDIEHLMTGYRNTTPGSVAGGEYRRHAEAQNWIDPTNPGPGGAPQVINAHASTAAELKDILIHEIQHAIQFRQGWPRGGSPSQMPNAKDIVGRVQAKAKPRFDALEAMRNPEVDDITLGMGDPTWSPTALEELRLGHQYRSLLEPPGKWDAQKTAYNFLEGENEARNAAWRALNVPPEYLRAGGTSHPERTADYPSSLTWRQR